MTFSESGIRTELLCDGRDALSPEFERCLSDIFTRFDKNENNVWEDEELDDFAVCVYGIPFGHDIKEEIHACLNCNEDGALTYLGLCQFYKEQTIENEEATWEDLYQLGFDSHLKWRCQESQRRGKRPSFNQCLEAPDRKEPIPQRSDRDQNSLPLSRIV
jgi:hypothetical protein